jgi:hypothetical protein
MNFRSIIKGALWCILFAQLTCVIGALAGGVAGAYLLRGLCNMPIRLGMALGGFLALACGFLALALGLSRMATTPSGDPEPEEEEAEEEDPLPPITPQAPKPEQPRVSFDAFWRWSGPPEVKGGK